MYNPSAHMAPPMPQPLQPIGAQQQQQVPPQPEQPPAFLNSFDYLKLVFYSDAKRDRAFRRALQEHMARNTARIAMQCVMHDGSLAKLATRSSVAFECVVVPGDSFGQRPRHREPDNDESSLCCEESFVALYNAMQLYGGEAPVGSVFVLPTKNARCPTAAYVAARYSLREPLEPFGVYVAFRAALLGVHNFNKRQGRAERCIRTVVCGTFGAKSDVRVAEALVAACVSVSNGATVPPSRDWIHKRMALVRALRGVGDMRPASSEDDASESDDDDDSGVVEFNVAGYTSGDEILHSDDDTPPQPGPRLRTPMTKKLRPKPLAGEVWIRNRKTGALRRAQIVTVDDLEPVRETNRRPVEAPTQYSAPRIKRVRGFDPNKPVPGTGQREERASIAPPTYDPWPAAPAPAPDAASVIESFTVRREERSPPLGDSDDEPWLEEYQRGVSEIDRHAAAMPFRERVRRAGKTEVADEYEMAPCVEYVDDAELVYEESPDGDYSVAMVDGEADE